MAIISGQLNEIQSFELIGVSGAATLLNLSMGGRRGQTPGENTMGSRGEIEEQ